MITDLPLAPHASALNAPQQLMHFEPRMAAAAIIGFESPSAANGIAVSALMFD